jgi:hypothetical protein
LKPTAVLALGFNNAIRKHRNERGLTQVRLLQLAVSSLT